MALKLKRNPKEKHRSIRKKVNKWQNISYSSIIENRISKDFQLARVTDKIRFIQKNLIWIWRRKKKIEFLRSGHFEMQYFKFISWPKLDFEAHKEYKKLNNNKVNIEKQKHRQYDDEEEEQPEQQAQYYNEIVDKLKKVRQRVNVEASTNYSQIDHTRGKTVAYGQDVFFMHYDSGQFLSGSVSCSYSDQSAYKLELSNVFNKGMTFKVMPRYKLRQEGEPIQYKDNILLFNQKLNCYINFFTLEPITLDKPIEHEDEPYYRVIDIERNRNRSRYEALISNSNEIAWQLLYFRELPDKDVNDILGGSLIYLKHAETQGYLTADFCYSQKDLTTESYIRMYQGEEDTENLSVFSVWEIEVFENAKRGEELILSNKVPNIKTGQDEYVPNKFILRHFLTGKVLTYNECNINGEKHPIPCLLHDQAEIDPDKSGVQFVSTSGEFKESMENNLCYLLAINNQQISVDESIKYKIQGVQIKKEERRKTMRLTQQLNQTNTQFSEISDERIYQPLEDSEFEVNRYGVLCEDKGSQEQNAFQMIRIEQSECQELFKVASQVSVLSRFNSLIKAKVTEIRTNKELIRSVQRALAKIIFFVSRSELEESLENAFKMEGVPIVKRQRIVRDFRLLELLMDILYYPFKYKLLQMSQLAEIDEELLKVFILSYKCIMTSIKEYRPNELYASQWLDLMIRQAKLTTDDTDIGAEETLTELIDNNRRILETKITTQTIRSFIEMLRDERSDKYVKMVYALCVCEGQPMIFNQAEVSQLILHDDKLFEELIFPISKKNGNIIVKPYREEEPINIYDFQRESGQKDEFKTYNFFLEMLTLLSGLCLGRNYLAMDILEQHFPLDLCQQIIQDHNANQDPLRKRFVKLVIHLYIDRAPFSKLVLPDRIRIWSEIEKKDDAYIPYTTNNYSHLQGFKDIINDYMTKESEKGYSKMFDIDKNQLTLEMLRMLRMLMEFGFYTSQEELLKVVEPLFRLLEGVSDVSNDMEDNYIKKLAEIKDNKKEYKRLAHRLEARYEDNEVNATMHQIKKIICQVMVYILKLRDSSRLSYMLKCYKEQMSMMSPLKQSKTGEAEDILQRDQNYIQKPIEWVEYLMAHRRINFVGDDILKVYEEMQNPASKQKFQSSSDRTLIFLDLTLYKHNELVNMSFQFLHDIYTQRHQTIQMMKEIQLLETPFQIETYNNLNGVIVEFGELVEKSEQWLWQEDDSMEQILKVISILQVITNNLVIVNKEKPFFGDEPDMELLPMSQNIINKKNQQQQQQQKQSDKNELTYLFTENCECNGFAQDLIRNLKIYELIINLLKFDADQFTYKRIQNSDEYVSPDLKSHKVLKLCYLALGRFCYLSQENQKLIMPYFNLVYLKHLKYVPTLDLYVLLEPFFQDNLKFLMDEAIVSDFLKISIHTIDSIPQNSPLKPAYFRCLQVLTKSKGKIIKQNQTMIINELTHRDYETIIETYIDRVEEFSAEVRDLQEKINSQISQGTIVIPPKLDYFNGLLQLMGIICQDKNNATESKTQQYFSIMHLNDLMEAAGNCFYVVKDLMFFFYHVYLDTEREMNDELMDIKKQLIDRVKKDLQAVSESVSENNQPLLTFRGYMTVKQVKEEYFFTALILCVETIIRKRMLDDYSQREEFHETLLKSVILMSDELDPSERKYKQIIRNTLALLISINVVTEEDLKQKLKNKEFIPNQKLIQSTKRSETGVHSGVKDMKVNQVSRKQIMIIKQMEVVTESKDFKQITRNEMNRLIQKISKIEELSKLQFRGTCTIPYNEILTSMIEFTKNTQKNVQLTIVRLQIFRRIIEQQNEATSDDIWNWKSEEWEDARIGVLKQQDQLVSLGIVKMIYALVQVNNQHNDIIDESINLSIALLLGGNNKSQQAFYNEMQEDNQNAYLVCIKDRVERAFETVKRAFNLYNKNLFEQICNGSTAGGVKNDQNAMLDVEDQELEINIENINEAEILEEEEHAAVNTVLKLLRLLQLLCEGHYLTMQDYLRQQIINGQVLGRTHDFVYMGAQMFASFTKFFNVLSLELGHQLIDFLAEMVQGPCHGNQIKLTSAKVVDSCKDLLSRFKTKGDYQQYGFSKDEEQDEADKIITKSTKLLAAINEGANDAFILNQMSRSLDIQQLFDKLKDSYYDFLRSIKCNPEATPTEIEVKVCKHYNDTIMGGFTLFGLIKDLQTQSEELQSMMKEFESPEREEDDMTTVINFFNSKTKSIEIQFKDDLIRVWFPVQPICRYLSKNTRTRIMQEAPRESPNEKVEFLVESAEGTFDEMNHMAYLDSLPFNFSQGRLNFLRDFSTLVSFLINLLMIITYHKEIDTANSQESVNVIKRFDIPTELVMNILGYIQLGTSSAMLVFWIFIHSPLLLTIKWRAFNEENQKINADELYILQKYENNETIKPSEIDASITVKLLETLGPQIPIFNRSQILKDFGNYYTLLIYWWKNFTFIFGDGEVKYFFFYITVSFVGSFINEIAYSLHLLDVIERFPTLQNVIKAITTNAKQLFLTTVLLVIVMYIWAIIGFYFFDDTFQTEVYDINGEARNENLCTTLLQCFIVVVNKGLIAGGGIGDFMILQSLHEEYRYAVTYIYNLLFFLVVKMAFMNIIFGIIIDTFAELRDKRNTMEEDMKNICYICGLERDVFDQFADGFENHIDRDHHLWNYLYYLYHLKIKNSTEHDGVESYVWQKYQSHDQSWMPLLKAMTVNQEAEDEDEETKVTNDIESIKKIIKDITTQIDRLSKKSS